MLAQKLQGQLQPFKAAPPVSTGVCGSTCVSPLSGRLEAFPSLAAGIRVRPDAGLD
jgi:hypothetical protein